MIPEIHRILYATDLSENARYAFGYAATLANKFDAKITLLHVLDGVNPGIEEQIIGYLGKEKWQQISNDNEKQFVEKIKARISDFCNQMALHFKECPFLVDQIKVSRGEPVEEILEHSNAKNCDIIVMGTHGTGLFSGKLMGSTARRVLRRSEKPVMVIPLS